MNSAQNKRLFVALWPSVNMQQKMASLLPANSKGIPVKTANIHATLVFIGKATLHQEAAYRAAISAIAFPPVDLTLNTFGWWKTPRVLWLGAKNTPSQLNELVALVNQKLNEAAGFIPEKRSFSLHITLARKHPGPTLDWGENAAINWHADTLALVESRATPSGVRYIPLLFRHAV